MLAFVLIQEDGMQFANNIYICFSGRGDRHRWLSLPVPSPLQECDAVANLSDDGNQLQVWPAPIRGFAFSFPNMPLMYLLFKDGSGRGAALVAAVLKGKGEWPLLHNSSSPNCLVDHLNQLWLEHPPNIWEVFKLCQPCPLNHQNTKSRISKETFPNSPPCYTWAWSHNLVNKSGAFHKEPTLSAYSPHCVHLPGHSSTAHAERQARRHFSAKFVSVAKNLCLCAWSPPCLSSSASYILY